MTQELIAVRSSCRVCNFSPLENIFSLGDLYVSDFISEDEGGIQKFPLELVLCNKNNGGCGLLQLKHTVSHEAMYRQYWYRSGTNKTMTDELCGIARKAESLVKLSPSDFVIDIGANDGTLLRGYSNDHLYRIGFEPAKNLMQYAQQGTTKIFNDFFHFSVWEKDFQGKQAKIITAIAMFYDLEDPNTFVSDVKKCLATDGIFIIQMSYLPSMLSQNAFDNICHEHLEYYSLLSLENLLQRHDLEVFDVELNDVNGGSFRIYIKHKNKGAGGNIYIASEAGERVSRLRESETELHLDKREIYDEFAKRIYELREQLILFIKKEHIAGKKIYVYGASTKGNTLLQFYNLDTNLIGAAAERNPDKWGKKTIGTMIPIISEEQAREDKPDYFFILPWHFLEEFRKREADFLNAGGKFIIPLPTLKVE